MKKFILANLVFAAITAHASTESTVTYEEYTVAIKSSDFSSYQYMAPKIDRYSTTKVDIGGREFVNPSYALWSNGENPTYSIVGAGEADKFLIAVSNDGCQVTKTITLAQSEHEICNVSIEFQPTGTVAELER
ncbi:hypothetical protein [Photobacterium lutimaris]|uniref:Uncharacterized protein n=1 Tax=Photobacterium lutimaris TaxID=388278 RepID=A0A2T3ITN2_9GAMM|nr:hypothetical protein [Photobacterium lutimaris]PSU31720.1 hypothetical protein C9I99_21275 [Photobacterium lutimaris]TDR72640.1 hypothetical protein DFP78_113116 [Photobacterium lutimaris]